MTYYIQSQDENHITIFIDMIDYCSVIEKKKQERSAYITKSKPSLYLGGQVLKTSKGYVFDSINNIQFYNTGLDLNSWISFFNILQTFHNILQD